MGNKSFQDEFVKNDKNIVIPLLQRDYVQGDIKRDIINEFLEKLISALEKENGTEDLNYIYGYEKNGCFVPIDGQQRLITLWLLHLYIYSKDSKVLPVELKFESREFADNFCEKLRKELPQILAEKVANLKETITDKQWFISGWENDTTVDNMLNTLNLINKKLDEKNNLHTENIVFDFLDMEGKGLDDDVYVKMNGRGRPLSYFENLKSWMDKECADEYWKVCMDNKWTDLFWNNRNKEQEHPEEIDDEQMRFFYSMLLLYWKLNENNFLKSSNIIADKVIQNNYISFLNEWERETNKISEDIADEDIIEEIQNKTFSLLLKGEKMIPLYWIKETQIFNNEVFKFIKEGLDALDKIKDCINDYDSESYKDIICVLDLVSDEKQSYLYQLAFKEATYTQTLPLLYALIKTPEKYQDRAHFYQWVRLWRNLVIKKSDIDADNIGNACKTINDVSNKVGNNDNLYEVVSLLKVKEGIGFKKEQFIEEIAKAKKINGDTLWENKIIAAEKYAFFKGAIRFLFYNENGKVDWRNFDIKWRNAQKYFDKKGVSEEYRKDALLLRAFLSRIHIEDNLWFDNGITFWNDILCDAEYYSVIDEMLKTDKIEVSKSCEMWIKSNSLLSELLGDEDDKNWHILSGWRNHKVLTRYTRRESGSTNAWNEVVVLDHQRNKLFKNKKIEVYESQCIKNCDGFYYGWDVYFKYNNKYFLWWGNPDPDGKELDVYLLNDNWNGYKKHKKIVHKKTDEDEYYCFRVTDDMYNNSDKFLRALEKLG